MISVVIPAAGMGKRTGLKENKMFFCQGEKSVIEQTVERFLNHPLVDMVCVVCRKDETDRMKSLFGDKVLYALGGETRGQSVYNGLRCVENSDKVLIHDGARPYVDDDTITNVINGIASGVCALAGIKVVDTLKKVDENGFVINCPNREEFRCAQTPQGFITKEIISAYEQLNDFTLSDDSQVFEKIGNKVKIVQGSQNNIKITTSEDLKTEKIYLSGIGYDVHQLTENRKLIIGGVEIPYEYGLLGHSDADVLLHAVCDAILGATGLGDIGKHFPDTDDRYKGISSMILLENVNKLIEEKGYKILNVSAIVVAQKPKLAPYISKMNENIAHCLNIPAERVNVAATTTEKLGFEGRKEGISSTATVMIVK